jgi:hypothetical protein
MMISIAVFLLVVISALALYTMYIQPNITGAPKINQGSVFQQSVNTGATPPRASGVQSGAPEALQFYLKDNLGGGAISGATVKVYTSANVQTDSLTTSSGSATSGSQWTPGQSGYVQITKPVGAGVAPVQVSFTVPSIPTIGQYGTPTYYIPLAADYNGTYTLKCFDNLGNAYTTGQTVNFTTLGVSTVTLEFTVYNSASNTGWITSQDSLNNVNQAMGITMSSTGSSVSLPNGLQGGTTANAFPRGTSLYWSTTLSDSALSNQKIGQVQTLLGQAPFSVTINKAALTAGNSQAFVLTLVGPFDSTYYQNNGVGGPNAASYSSAFTINVGA